MHQQECFAGGPATVRPQRSFPARLLATVGALVLTGCGVTGEGTIDTNGATPCGSDADCDSGDVCRGGRCVPESMTCTGSHECSRGYVCEAGVCVPEPQGECRTDEDCVENAYCRSTAEGTFCACRENYYHSDGVCLPESRVVPCTNDKPMNSSWTPEYAGGELTQTWDGDQFAPAADTCEWACDAGYHEHTVGTSIWCVECVDNSHCQAPTPACDTNMNTCVQCMDDNDCTGGDICLDGICEENPRTYNCPPKPPVGTEWNTVSEYQQEWNAAAHRWEPEDSETHYNETPDDTSCRFVCSNGYRWNGETCEEQPTCSSGNQFGSSVTAMDLLHAMDICDVYEAGAEGSFGIVPGSALIGRANWPADSGTVNHLQYGVTTQFGTHSSNLPIFGDNMAVLSSGRARDAQDPDPTANDSYTYTHGQPPADFVAPHGGQLPQTRSDCPNGAGANDSVNLRVQLKVPEFANAFSFDFRFFSQEYRDYTCTVYNDFFIAMLDTSWTSGPGESSIPADKNVSFDSFGNYISVNSDQFFQICRSMNCGRSGVHYPCPGGTAPLQNTGYHDSIAGATEWLTTTAPVVPGETITLRFIIWDTSDRLLDSLVLIDNFRWHAEPGGGPTTQPSCLKPGAPCTSNADCCSGQCDTQAGYCL